MLRVVPKQYRQITLFIETILDLNTLSLEGLIDSLRAAEDRGNEEEETAFIEATVHRGAVRQHQHARKDRVENSDGGRRGGGHDEQWKQQRQVRSASATTTLARAGTSIATSIATSQRSSPSQGRGGVACQRSYQRRAAVSWFRSRLLE